MSADNYINVRKWRGKYVIEMRFASADYDNRLGPREGHRQYDSVFEAVARAHEIDDTEYGVRFSPAVHQDLVAAAALKGKST